MKNERISTSMLDELVIVEHVGFYLLGLVKNVYLGDQGPMYSVKIIQACTPSGSRIYTPHNPFTGEIHEKSVIKTTSAMGTATDVELQAHLEMLRRSGYLK